MTEPGAIPAPDGPRRRGCLSRAARGCCGCLVALLILGLAAALVGWATKPGAERRESTEARPEGALVGPGRVVLELEEGSFRVEPAAPGEPLHAEAQADAETSELSQELVTEADGTWTWRVRYGSSVGLVRRAFAGRRKAGRVVVRIPPDLPIDLELRLSKGESDVELGGLRLTGLFARLSMGDHRVRFSRPLLQSPDLVEVEMRMGEARFDDLGNASPSRVETSSRFGALALGLAGAWQGPASVSSRFSMGELRVVSPDGLDLAAGSIRVTPGDVTLPMLRSAADETASAGPSVRLDVDGGFGELRVERLPAEAIPAP